ncbi:hypothetical protein, partial [Phocaeicola plebeius]|uniref:hypothetical protein n=1 Tax=Phocaeicola plebeius TaxID=310297 RepID=UPI003AB6B961
ILPELYNSHKIKKKEVCRSIFPIRQENKKVNYRLPNLLNRPLSNYSLKRFFNFATEKASNTKRFNELNYKVLSELKRENRFTI